MILILKKLLIFIQMVRLYKDPKGDTIFTHVTNDATGAAGTGFGTGFATGDDHDRVANLEKKVKELQAQLAAYDVIQYHNTMHACLLFTLVNK